MDVHIGIVKVMSTCMQMWVAHHDAEPMPAAVGPVQPFQERPLIAATCEGLAVETRRVLGRVAEHPSLGPCAAPKQSGLLFVKTDGVVVVGDSEIPFARVDDAVANGLLGPIAGVLARALCARLPGTDCPFPSAHRDEGREGLQRLLEVRVGVGQPLMRFFLPCLVNTPGVVTVPASEHQRRYLYFEKVLDRSLSKYTKAAAYLPHTSVRDCWDSFLVHVPPCATEVGSGIAFGEAAAYEAPPQEYGQLLGTVVAAHGICARRPQRGCSAGVTYRVHLWPTAVHEGGHVLIAVSYATQPEAPEVTSDVLGVSTLQWNRQMSSNAVLRRIRQTAVVTVLAGLVLMTAFIVAVRTALLGLVASLVPFLFGCRDASDVSPLMRGPFRMLLNEALLVGRVAGALHALVPRELRALVDVVLPTWLSLAVAVGTSARAVANITKVLQQPPHRVIEGVAVVLAVSARVPPLAVSHLEARLAAFAESVGGVLHPCPPGFFTAMAHLDAPRGGAEALPVERHVIIPLTAALPVGDVRCEPLTAALAIVTPLDLDEPEHPMPFGGAQVPRPSDSGHSLARSSGVSPRRQGGKAPEYDSYTGAFDGLPPPPRLAMSDYVPLTRGVVVYAAAAAAALHAHISNLSCPEPVGAGASDAPKHAAWDGNHPYADAAHPDACARARGAGTAAWSIAVGCAVGPITRGYLRLTTSTHIFPEAVATGWPITIASLVARIAERDGLGAAVDVGPPDAPLTWLVPVPAPTQQDGTDAPAPPTPWPDAAVEAGNDAVVIRVYDAFQFYRTVFSTPTDGRTVRIVAQAVPVVARVAAGGGPALGSGRLQPHGTLRGRVTRARDAVAAAVTAGRGSTTAQQDVQQAMDPSFAAAARALSDAVALGLSRHASVAATCAAIAAHLRAYPMDSVALYLRARWGDSYAAEDALQQHHLQHPHHHHHHHAAPLRSTRLVESYTGLAGDPLGSTDVQCAEPLPLPAGDFGGCGDSTPPSIGCDGLSVQSSVSVEPVIEDADQGAVDMSARQFAADLPQPRRVAVMYLSSNHAFALT